VEFYVQTDQDITYLPASLGYWLWNVAVLLAPEDTGNLKRSITMNRNSDKTKLITYNVFNAVYLHYLEEGMGSVKKYKDFIKTQTVGQFIVEIIDYIKTGKTKGFGTKPLVTLSISSNGAMFYERRMLKQLDGSKKNLTADDRKTLSQLRYNGLKNTYQQGISGKTPSIKRLYKTSENLQTNMRFFDPKSY